MRLHRFKFLGVEYLIISYPIVEDLDPRLSRAEREIVGFVVEGRSNQQIGRARGTSARTIANQLARTYRKLGVGSRRELVARLAFSPGDTR
ncbi:MAG: helix-turn-helix transcriptional regulator [Deltaproteobacteria bacterium]|nr:helix-turn-helix transcriptional regulator [Deltaproteobacteria bacterium]